MMKRNQSIAFLLCMLLMAVFVCPTASADAILATLKDGVVTQTTLSDNLSESSIETSAQEQEEETPGFWAKLFSVFRWNEPETEETVIQSREEPTPTPSDEATEEPTPTPSDDEEEPTPTPSDDEATPTPSDDEATPTPSDGNEDSQVTVSDMSVETEVNKKVSGTLTSSSFDEGVYHFEIKQAAKNGTAQVLDPATGSYEYEPNADYTGTDSFTFVLTSDDYTTPEATVTITIKEASTPTPPAETASIYDDMENHYARKAAEWLYEENHVKGETVAGDTFFYPDYAMTRVQFITFANSVFFSEEETGFRTGLPFVDITAETPDYVVRAATKAYENGFVSGSNDDGQLYFKPYENLTRLQVVIMLHNVLKPAEAPDVALDFTDADTIPAYATGYVKDMLNIGMIKGFDDGSFRPNELITRGQAAQLLYNAVQQQQGKPLLRLK